MTRVEQLVRGYLDRTFGVSPVAQQDPEFHFQVHLLRRVLHIADLAMEAEGVGEEQRVRVIRTVLFGVPDPFEAERRVAARDEQVRLAMQGLPVRP